MHEITVRADGFAEAVYYKRPAWHNLGDVSQSSLTSGDLLRYLDWDPIKVPNYYYVGGKLRESHKSVSLLRSDNHFELASVSPTYGVYSHKLGLKMLDSLLMDGCLKYEAAFSLRGGKTVVIVARLPSYYSVSEDGQDNLLPFLMCVFNHTGQQNILTLPTFIRPVCSNTVAMALAAGIGQILSVRHSGDMEVKMERARESLSQLDAQFTDHVTNCRKLASVKVCNGEMKPFLEKLYPVVKFGDPEFSNRRVKSTLETHAKIRHNFVSDPAQQIPATRHSWYAAYNAVTQFVDHRTYRGASTRAKQETQFLSANLGPGQEKKIQAFDLAMTHVS